MCRCLEVTRSGYYAWASRGISDRARADQSFKLHIRAAHEESGRTYGSPRVTKELRANGIELGRHRVARLMRAMSLAARRKKRFVRTTTPSEHSVEAAPNLLDRRFEPGPSDGAWAADTTYIATAKGWVYLAVVMSIASRRIVGWSIAARNDEALTLGALEMALALRRAPELHHSDRGSQYTSDAYQRCLAAHQIRCSMSRLGNCWDNAIVESVFSTIKTEEVRGAIYASHDEARQALTRYLVFYNTRRRHSSLGYVSPMEYERRAVAA